ncbi:hypothetical protein [Nocardia blacklockiae]|uniref:hypothetical protein n=1 Tax=Nocardia blacklockiae TaxID=480036 RepID=UPI00189488A8|nr:hypothetical protein [Nocardia blacklockiae]MBF6171949.1 hypothetical protein [Nocardia blacklockiae]
MAVPAVGDVLQIAGALLLLGGFIGAQRGLTDDRSAAYLVANTTGSAVLAALAYLGRDWGFLLLEGTWAIVAGSSLCTSRWVSRSHDLGGASEVSLGHARASTRALDESSAAVRTDELSRPDRLIHFFRDTYAGSQGRQWLQPHVMWWMLAFLRDNDVRVDLDSLAAPDLADRAAAMALPRSHQEVTPSGHVEMNFRLWWSILGDIARVVYAPRWRRLLETGGARLVDAGQLEKRALGLGLQPWMTSATFEELAGIARSLAVIAEHERLRLVPADEIMVRVLLPELLLAEMHWLHIPPGRPPRHDRPAPDIVLLRRCALARARWSDGRYLDPLDQLYLRAGDLLERLTGLPDHAHDDASRRIVTLYTELLRRERASETPEPHGTEPITAAREGS